MAPPSGRRTRSMTVLRRAPRLDPVDKAPAYETIGRWLHWRLHKQHADQRWLRDTNQRLEREVAELRLRAPRAESPARQRVEEVIQRILLDLGGATSINAERVGGWQNEVEVADVVAALRDLGSVYRRAEDIALRAKSTAREVNRLLKGIDQGALDDLDAAMEKLRERNGVEVAA